MKKITLLFIFFFALASYSQTKGITYQAVLLNPAGNQTRGVGQNLPLMDKQICMSFKFVDEFSNVEYQEVVQAKTDSYGMVNLIIGSGEQTAGYASSFSDISWSTSNKKLVVGVNTNGNCTTFIEISNQDFSFVPFAYAATNAENVTGVVSIENGGTNATTVIQAKTNLQLQNVNNTADLDKPISTATQTALGIKVDKQTGKGLSTEDYTSLEKTKLAAISGSNTGDQDLSTFATNTNLALKVDQVAGKGLSTEDYSTVEKAKLAAISGSNTGDQDLSSFATNTNLALKVDKVAGKGLSTEDYTSLEKTKLAAISGSNTGDQDLSTFATSTDLALKVDKVTGKGLSTEDYSTVEKAKLGAISGSNTGDQDLSGFATITNLALKVDKQTGKGLSTEDYTSSEKTKLAAISGSNTGDQDLSSFATNTNLAVKVDKVAGKGLSTEDYSTVEKAKLAAISGSNTGDQDLSSFATNTKLALKVDKVVGKGLSTEDYTSLEKTKLAAISGSNTGDQDLSSYVTTTDLALKLDKVAGKSLSTEDYTSSEKTKLAAISGSNTGDQDLSSFATNTNLALKVDKVTGKGLSTEDYSTTEKTKLAAISGNNTGDQDLSTFATLTNLALKASINSPIFLGTPTLPIGAVGFTQIEGESSTSIATTAFVSNAVSSATTGKFVDLTTNQIIDGSKSLISNVRIGTTTPSTSAVLEVSSTTQGFLPPRVTQTERNLISSPVAGLIVWCKNCGENGEIQVFNGIKWTNFIGNDVQLQLAEGSNFRGGKIAYVFQVGDPGFVSGEFHGIIVSNSDLSNGVRWGQNFNGLTTTYDCTNRHGSSGFALPCAIGAGNSNTALIIASNTETNPTSYAAQICADYSITINGAVYDDWFLPSYNEMLKIYQNKSSIGDLYYDSTNSANKSNWYWTSTGDVFQDRAADVSSLNGAKARNFRGSLLSVRAARYF